MSVVVGPVLENSTLDQRIERLERLERARGYREEGMQRHFLLCDITTSIVTLGIVIVALYIKSIL